MLLSTVALTTIASSLVTANADWLVGASSGAGAIVAAAGELQHVFDTTDESSEYEDSVEDFNNNKPEYSPLRPPAIPLAVRGPYTNIWQDPSDDQRLVGDKTSIQFWNSRNVGWTGMVSLDGVVYQYMGEHVKGAKIAREKSVKFDTQWTNYTFDLGNNVDLQAQFFSPVTPEDVCRMSIPLSYLTVKVESDSEHDLQLYNDIDGKWVTSDADEQLTWRTENGGGNNNNHNLNTIYAERKNPILFGEHPDQGQSQYGNLTFTSIQGDASEFSSGIGKAGDTHQQFVNGKKLTTSAKDTEISRDDYEDVVFAYTHDFGKTKQASVLYTMGMIHEPVVSYLGKGGIQHLDPWWKNCYSDKAQDVIEFHYNDFENVARLGYEFEQKLQNDIKGYYQLSDDTVLGERSKTVVNNDAEANEYGQSYLYNPSAGFGYLNAAQPQHGVSPPGIREEHAYYAITALSARQFFSSYSFTKRPAGNKNTKDPYVFQKETSSNANMNTADVYFPATPFFIWANPELLVFTMDPVFDMVEDGFYPHKYAIHDIGNWYPRAIGYVAGNDEYMPVEECGNQITASLMYYRATGDVEYLSNHYDILKQYSEYLVEFSLFPASQVSTDDFAGPLFNQTNLAIKGIVGLRSMSEISLILENIKDSSYYNKYASDYYSTWKNYAVDPTFTYTLLGHSWRGSWGQLYNAYPAYLLDIDIDDKFIQETQHWTDHLLTKSQKFGIPLDSRHSWTKSDWLLWIAGMTANEDLRRVIITTMAFYLDSSQSGRPFIDLYDTITGEFPTTGPYFNNRPVCGGHYSLLANYKLKSQV